MSMLNLAYIQLLYKALDNEFFTSADFDIVFPETGKEFAKVIFRHDPNYCFTIIEDYVKKGGLHGIAMAIEAKNVPATVECPGDHKALDVKYFDSLDACVYRIPKWCKNIQNDLRAKTPIIDEFEELRNKFDEHIKEHLNDPNAVFEAEELAALNSKFDDLFQQFVKLEESHSITQNALTDIQREFEIIKQNAHIYNKGLWANLTKNRMIKILFDGLKRLLGV